MKPGVYTDVYLPLVQRSYPPSLPYYWCWLKGGL